MTPYKKKSTYVRIVTCIKTRGFFVFIKRFLHTLRRYILRARAQRRVQRMLKNNFVKTKKEQQKKMVKDMTSDKVNASMGFIPRAYRGVAAIFSISFLILTILTSQYYGPQFIEAEILVQNFTGSETIVNEGFDMLKYETRSEEIIDDMTEFDAGSYTSGNFEVGEDDLLAIDDTNDYLTLGSYGDTPPDTSQNDWWAGETIQTCSAATFQAGTFTDTQWDTSNGWAELTGTGLTAGTGEYESHVIDAGVSVSWSDMMWTSTRPTYKELPNNLGAESVYSAGNVDMSNNLLTMHFNESANPIIDNSGVTGNGSYNGTQWNQGGRFNTALGFDGVDDMVDLGQDLSSVIGGTGSVAFWMNTTQAGNDTPWNAPGITGSEQAGTGDDVFWGFITASGTIGMEAGNTTGARSTTVVNDGQWHHIVLTRDHLTGEVEIYVNGFLEDTAISETGIKTQYFDGIGRIYDSSGTHGWYQGLLDEVSFWSDIMTPTEVYDHYRRGANRLKFQVRSCDDVMCVGESYVGPDGTGATYYTEELNSTINLPSVTLASVPDNQYLQWRVEFETDNNTMSPELLCVTFNNGDYRTWAYRKCFDVDHTAPGAQNETEYQIYFDTDTQSLVNAGRMQADGSDIRFLDSDENILTHYIADDMNTLSTRIWLEMDNIDAGTTEEICMYYGNSGAANVESREEVFTYQNQEDIYYVVQESANGTTTEFVSYTDNNNIAIDTYTGIRDQYDADSHIFPTPNLATIDQETGIAVTDPISAGYNVDGTDNIVPASFAGTSFVYRMDRGTNEFSFLSPWCSADVVVRNENENIVTGGSFTTTQGVAYNLATDNGTTTGIANDSAVIVEVTNGCPILATHHTDTGGDSFVMVPAAEEWYGVGSSSVEIAALNDNTNVTLYRSSGSSSTYTLNRGENVSVNDPGSQGSDPAHRVVADDLVGVKSIADGDGLEAATFLPVSEMGYRYYFPENIQYITIATREGLTTTVDLYNDATSCGIGTPDDTDTVTASANYPGKVYFGSTTNGVNIAQGACIVADNPIYAYYEEASANDEHNAWNEVQNKQYIYPTPTYSVGTTETGAWSVDGSNTWTRRIPVTLNNSSAVALSEYQVRVDLGVDANELFGNTQSDGGDIRVAGSAGDGSDDVPYALNLYNDTTNTGDLWVQVPSIAASGSTTFYIYYYPAIVSQEQTCSQSAFDNGSYADTQWDGTNSWVELTATGLTNGTGQYTSEIFDAGSATTWNALSWESHYPTHKELPDNAGIESEYDNGNIDMTGNVLLLHMNESSGTIIDSSGNGNNGTYNGSGYGAAGRFNTGLDFDGVNDEIVIPDDNTLDFGAEVTAAAWVYLDTLSGWQSFFHKNINTASQQEVYFEQNNGVLYNYNTINSGTAVLTAGQWHHIAYTADATTETIYVDGQVVASEPVQYAGMSNTYNLYIGGSGGGGEQVNGRMDEAAMWNRTLTSTEISDLYRRGANRLGFQVRSCDDVACSGESFSGPDGTGATYYTEETNNTLGLPSSVLTNVIDNRYFQYETTFLTDDNAISPELMCVTIDSVSLQSGFSTTGDYDAIFSTTTEKINYYIVDELSAAQTASLISFADGNSISDGTNSQTVNEGEIVTLPLSAGSGSGQEEIYSVTGPIHAAFNGDVTDAALPIAYAGTEFVYVATRDTDSFSFYAPFADASVDIQESGPTGWTTLQTVTVTQGTALNVAQDIINGRAFKVVSDEPILGFHAQINELSDSNILYPTHLALEEDSGSYELYGVSSGVMTLAAVSDANVTIYRSDGTSASATLNNSNNYTFTDTGSAQGVGNGIHIVSDAPIGATGNADGDGVEAVTFLSQKEFSDEYILSQPAQYFSVVARDPSVTCRVYDDTGAEVTTDSTGTMDNIPPQTSGTQSDPYPNNIHIGGADTTDGAYFDAGYSMQCTEPVYAYYERHLSTVISDETSWLTWPQVRKRAYVEPIAEDIDNVDEQGFYYESGMDSATTGNDFEAYAEYTFDTSALIYGEHTYWRDITWEEIINSRSATNGVEQVSVEVAYADPAPTCDSAVYSTYTTVSPTTLATSTDTSLPYVDYTTNTQQVILPDEFSDHSCVKVRIYLRTGDQVYAPRISSFDMGYYVPTMLEDQLNAPSVSVVGATSGNAERYRMLKVVTNDPGLNGSQALTSFNGVSNGPVFTQADLDLFEVPSQTTNAQFTFPPFPGTTPVTAATTSPVDASNDIAVYFTHERSAGAIETLDFIFNVDITGSGGPQLTRDFQLEVSGL
jgi:hypothetical protein